MDADDDAGSDCKSGRRLRLVAAAGAGTKKTALEGKRDAAQAAGRLRTGNDEWQVAAWGRRRRYKIPKQMRAENEAGGNAATQRARTT